jgi:hypothetical protein
MTEAEIVTCPTCSVMWDLNFDPPGCTDPDHVHTLSDVDPCPCTTGWDLGITEYGDTIAYVHPDCPLHSEKMADDA